MGAWMLSLTGSCDNRWARGSCLSQVHVSASKALTASQHEADRVCCSNDCRPCAKNLVPSTRIECTSPVGICAITSFIATGSVAKRARNVPHITFRCFRRTKPRASPTSLQICATTTMWTIANNHLHTWRVRTRNPLATPLQQTYTRAAAGCLSSVAGVLHRAAQRRLAGTSGRNSSRENRAKNRTWRPTRRQHSRVRGQQQLIAPLFIWNTGPPESSLFCWSSWVLIIWTKQAFKKRSDRS